MGEGKKFDTGKVDYSLVPVKPLEEIAKIMTFGATKYGRDNWRDLENFENRYYAAAMRHIMEWKKGNSHDDESGEHHLSHALTNLVFLLEKELKKDKKEFDN